MAFTDEEAAQFIKAYTETLLWSETAFLRVEDDGTIVEDPDNGKTFLDWNFGVDEIDGDGKSEIEQDCIDFLNSNEEDLRAALPRLVPFTLSEIGQMGHDFALTRNHHGFGFWDRGLGEVGERLTKAAHAYGAQHLMWDGDAIIVTG